MIRVVYVSTATPVLSDEDLVDILQVSRRNNTRDDVTGLLLYRGGNIMQALEGPAEAVEHRMKRIEEDPRHHGVQLLSREENVERFFPDWSMGFYPIENLDEEDQAHVNAFLQSGPLPVLSDTRNRVRVLLETFREVVR